MHEAVRYFAKTLLHFLKYLLVPQFVATGILFSVLMVSIFLRTQTEPDMWMTLIVSSFFALICSSLIFIIKTSEKISSLLSANKRVNSFFQRYAPKKEALPIEARLVLKPYLRWLSISFVFLFASFLLLLLRTTVPPASPTFGLIVIFYMCAGFFLALSGSVYDEKERATYFIQRFCQQIEQYSQDGNTAKLNMKFLERFLKSYERTLPDCWFLGKLKEKIMQTELVLYRGSKKDIQRMLQFLQQIYTSVNNGDAPSFERHFDHMIVFLEENQANRSRILELKTASRKERLKGLLFDFPTFILEKVMPTLIAAAIIILVYILFGIRIPI